MAILHSRFRRVFYGAPDVHGALGSKYSLHLHPNVNHRFQVFRFLEQSAIRRACESLKSGII